jgi:hypothetical protein
MPKVLLVGGDLMARSRLESAAQSAGAELRSVAVSTELAPELTGIDLVVLDLDSGGRELVERWRATETRARAVAYVSHVDRELMDAAVSARIDALPRGRFWRTAQEMFANLL